MVAYPAWDEVVSLLAITLETIPSVCDAMAASNKGWNEGLGVWSGLLYMTMTILATYKEGMRLG